MIVLHKPTETNFNKNGKAILKGAILNGVLTHKINGACMITIEMLKGNPKTDLVGKEDIITCPTPFGVQPFRVFDINPLGIDSVQIVARHIFFDLQKRVVKRCKVDSANGQFILDKYLLSLDKPVPHKLYSDMKELVSLDWQLKQGVDILLGDEENSFINKYGKGELRVDGFNGYINSRIGRNRGFKAKFKKNITGFSGKTSTDGLITYIIPKGFDGITLPDNGGVESPLISKYADVYTKVVEFPSVKFKDSPNNSTKEGFETLEEAQAELRRVAEAYFTDTECDIIKASFNIDLIMLKNTLEYKDVAVSEEIQLGDTITVDYSPYNITMEKRLVGYTYNILTEAMETLEVGDYGLDYFRSINNKIDKLPDVEQIVGDLENDISGKLEEFTNDLINGGNGSYVKFIPNFHNPREILILDSETEAQAKKVIRINKEGIGVSTTGVTGQYYGLVVDGKLIVSEATANKIVASLIHGGMLASIDNSSYINLDNGEFNFKDKIKFVNGKLSIILSNGNTIEGEIDGSLSEAKEYTDALGNKVYTKQEVETKIEALDGEIKLEVSEKYSTKTETSNAKQEAINSANSNTTEKLKNYSTTTEMNSAISVASENIELGVSKKYSTKQETITAKNEAINSANNNTTERLKSYSTTSEMNSAISLASSNIELGVSQRYSTKQETTTAKQEAINSANATTDNKLRSYSTTAEMKSAINLSAESVKTTVSQTYSTKSEMTNAKNEAINSANSNTTEALKPYAKTSEVQQTVDGWVAKFSSSGGYNLIKNGKAKNGTYGWSNNGGGLSVGSNGSFDTCFNTSMPSGIRGAEVKLKNNTDYVYEAWIWSASTIGGGSTSPLHFWCSSSSGGSGTSQATIIDYRQNVSQTRTWTKCYVHFRTKASGSVYFTPFIYTGGGSYSLSVSEISLTEGEIETAWTPHPSEIYEGSTRIDASGVTVFNGAIRVKNNSGEMVFQGDSAGNISMKGSIETINDYGRLYLNGNSLKGFLNASSSTPIYASGVWRPNNDSFQTGYVSVGNTNALIGDNNGCLYMTGANNSDGTRAMLKYSRNNGNIFGSVEFTQYGGTSLVSSLNGGRDKYGIWNSAEGYVLPLKGNEYLGKNDRYWAALYVKTTVSYNLNSVIDRSRLLGEVQSGTQRMRTNTPTKEDFIECIKGLNFGMYDSRDNVNARVLRTTNELTCKPIINTNLKSRSNSATNLLVKECTDREGENPTQTIDLTSYCSALAITLQDTISKVETLEEENRELKERLSKIESLLGINQ